MFCVWNSKRSNVSSTNKYMPAPTPPLSRPGSLAAAPGIGATNAKRMFPALASSPSLTPGLAWSQPRLWNSSKSLPIKPLLRSLKLNYNIGFEWILDDSLGDATYMKNKNLRLYSYDPLLLFLLLPLLPLLRLPLPPRTPTLGELSNAPNHHGASYANKTQKKYKQSESNRIAKLLFDHHWDL